MDAFYASVEERDNPTLVGRPVIVGGSLKTRGVVSAANYIARQYGVHSAMPSVTAHRLCPEAVFLPPRMDAYAEVSHSLREVFHRYTPLVEPLALDEAFLDVSESISLFGAPAEIGRRIKQEIALELRLVASVGVASNKFLAKLASDLRKPDGFVVVKDSEVHEFLDPLPVARLWGVGTVAQKKLHQAGIKTIGELRHCRLDQVVDLFGRCGDHLWQLANGIDERRVVPDHEAKSISHETTFASDTADRAQLRATAMDLTEQVARRMRRLGLQGRTIHLKIRYSDFTTTTRSRSIGTATHATQTLWLTVLKLCQRYLDQDRKSIRLLGVGVSNFSNTEPSQGNLFDNDTGCENQALDQLTDQIQERFGKRAVRRGITIKPRTQ